MAASCDASKEPNVHAQYSTKQKCNNAFQSQSILILLADKVWQKIANHHTEISDL